MKIERRAFVLHGTHDRTMLACVRGESATRSRTANSEPHADATARRSVGSLRDDPGNGEADREVVAGVEVDDAGVEVRHGVCMRPLTREGWLAPPA
jgi:hypothetical protein